MIRDLMVDGAKASPLAVYLVGLFSGVNWPAVAAALAAVYSLLLIIEKLYRWFFRPRLAVARPGRTAQDE